MRCYTVPVCARAILGGAAPLLCCAVPQRMLRPQAMLTLSKLAQYLVCAEPQRQQ